MTIPLFALIAGLSVWNFADQSNFNVLWRWFAWSNQVIAAFALSVATIYLFKEGKYKFGSFITAVPALFMSIVTLTYILGEPNIAFGKFIPMHVAYIVGALIPTLGFVVYVCVLIKKKVE